MTTIYLWGCSDDLIEVSGDFEEEYSPPADSFKVVFSDGTVIDGAYNGDWIYNVDIPGQLICTKFRRGTKEAEQHTNGRDYSDVMCVQGNFSWFVITDRITEIRSC